MGTQLYWKIFWKLFGTAFLMMIVIGVVLGIVKHSVDTTYIIVQQTIAVALSVCGFIGFVIIPIEMYFEERKQRNVKHAAE